MAVPANKTSEFILLVLVPYEDNNLKRQNCSNDLYLKSLFVAKFLYLRYFGKIVQKEDFHCTNLASYRYFFPVRLLRT